MARLTSSAFQPGRCSPPADWGLEVVSLSLVKAHSHSGKEIMEAFRDLELYLSRDQREARRIASDSPALLATNPPGGIKLCQRMKLKYLKYNLHTSFSKAGAEMV